MFDLYWRFKKVYVFSFNEFKVVFIYVICLDNDKFLVLYLIIVKYFEINKQRIFLFGNKKFRKGRNGMRVN